MNTNPEMALNRFDALNMLEVVRQRLLSDGELSDEERRGLAVVVLTIKRVLAIHCCD